MGAQFDREKCLQRNRIAALRRGVETAPIRFLAEAPMESEESGTLTVLGALPASEAEALEAINAERRRRDPDCALLSPSDVYLHYAEAANGSFIADRFAFLGSSSLRNIATGAAAGVAFMNSHHTGDFSAPSELPFGRTFAGRYEAREAGGKRRERTVVGFYMLRGVKPAGDAGPSTDDLHRMIEGGTLFDVSVGLYGGEKICDVCGHGLYERDSKGKALCPHIPGSAFQMTEEERAAQEARGVTRGMASYTLQDAIFSELSGVYDGAVPGAGFKKAAMARRTGDLPAQTLQELSTAYGRLWGHGVSVPEEVLDDVAERIAERLATLRTDGDEATDEAETPETGASVPQRRVGTCAASEEETDMRKHEEPGTESQAQGAEGLEASAIVTEAAAGAAAETPSVQLTEGAGEAPVPVSAPASAPASALAPAEALQAKLDEMQSRLLAVEAENATLRLQRLRGEVEGELSDLRFCEGRLSLAPASREGLTELICGLPEEPRRKALEALKGLQLVELGERGFGSPEAAATLATLSAEEERTVADIAKRTGVTPEVAREQYLTVRATRAAS